MNDRLQEWKESTWRVSPALNVPGLDPETVQIAVLESDPIQNFRKLLRDSRSRFLKEIAEERDPSQRELHKKIQIGVTWDRLFQTTPGDHVYLLTPARSKTNESRVKKTIISSNTPDGRRWLTTKVAELADRPVCWCIPFDATTGKSIEIDLRPENLLDLQKEYHQWVEAG